MILIIGAIHKSYFVDKSDVKYDLNKLIKNSVDLEGEVSSTKIDLASNTKYNFNIYAKPIYTIKGKIISANNRSEIKLKIGTYYGNEMISIVMILMAFVCFVLLLYDSCNPFLTRRGKYAEIILGILLLNGIWGLFRGSQRKKQGEREVDNLIIELKKCA